MILLFCRSGAEVEVSRTCTGRISTHTHKHALPYKEYAAPPDVGSVWPAVVVTTDTFKNAHTNTHIFHEPIVHAAARVP